MRNLQFLLIGFLLIGCSANNNQEKLQKYLGVKIPSSITNIQIENSELPEFKRISLYAQFNAKLIDIDKLVQNLKLKKDEGANAIITGAENISFWKLSDWDAQLKIEHRYFSKKPEQENIIDEKIVLIWENGIAYLYKVGAY